MEKKTIIKASVGQIANCGQEYEHFYDLFRDLAYESLSQEGFEFEEDDYLNVTDYEVTGVEHGSTLTIEVTIEIER